MDHAWACFVSDALTCDMEVVIGRVSPLEVGQHSPEPTLISAFRFMPSSVPHTSLVPGGLKQAGCAVVGVGSLVL